MSGSERRVLDEAGGVGAMTWVMGIMVFLTVLAGAVGLGTAAAAGAMGQALAGRLTVQLGNAAAEPAVLAALRTLPGVSAKPVARAELAALLGPWLGADAADADLPVPVLIDAALAGGTDAERASAAVRRLDPGASIEAHANWMAPVASLLGTVTWLAALLVLLMASATAAVVVLAARAGLERHRATIEVMHMMGATDLQIARLFQRRIALDAMVGGAAGTIVALALVWFLGGRLAGLGSQLLGGAALALHDWVLLALVPVAFVVLATLAARVAVLRALGRML